MDDTDKPKRGRPRKYRDSLVIPRAKGRPKGSKNKPKLNSNTQVALQDNKLFILENNSNDADEYSRDGQGGDGTIEKDCLEIDHGNPTINKIISNNGPNINDNVSISSNINVSNENLSTSSDISIDISSNSNSNNILKNNSEILGASNDKHKLSNSSNKVLQNNKVTQTSKVKEIEITPELIIAARRKLASDNLRDFACLIDIPTAPAQDIDEYDEFSTMKLDSLAAHHLLICNELQNVIENKKHNLMIFMPPGSAKSTYTDIVFPAWALAKYPRLKLILVSYSDAPAFNQAKACKQLVSSPSYKNLFPNITIRRDSTAVDNWVLSNGASFRASGLFGDITSYRADIMIFDDPVKGRAAAESETEKKKAWDSYIDNCVSRLTPIPKPKEGYLPTGPQILIMTRWSEDDIAGRILPENWEGESGDFIDKDGLPWRVICLPAIADRDDDPLGRKIGEGLWPEWFSMAHWNSKRSNSRTWNSLYQQKPSPDDGDYFIRTNFKRPELAEIKAKELRYYMTSDYAVTDEKSDNKDPDNTVIYIWGLEDVEDTFNIYLVDSWVGKTKSDRWIKEQCKLIKKYQPAKVFGEGGVIQKAIEPMLIAEMRRQKLITNLVWLPSNKATGGKEIRARSAQSLVQEGRVFIPKDSIEGDNLINECIKFPAGKHDDRVDNLSLIGRAIDQITIKRPKYTSRKPPTVVTPFNRSRLNG